MFSGELLVRVRGFGFAYPQHGFLKKIHKKNKFTLFISRENQNSSRVKMLYYFPISKYKTCRCSIVPKGSGVQIIYIYYSYSHTYTQTTPISIRLIPFLNRLLPFSLRYTDYSNSHTDTQTTLILINLLVPVVNKSTTLFSSFYEL